MAVDYESRYEANTRPDILKAFRNLFKLNQALEVVVTGRFHGARKDGGYGHLSASTYKFEILSIEHVKELESQPW
jgi:hypothetical protein